MNRAQQSGQEREKAMKLMGVLLSLFTAIGSAQATPFEFTFHDTVGGWAPCYLNGTCPLMPGVSVGDLITVSVTVDNGQNTLENQSWYQSDVTSATAAVGSYFGEFAAPFYLNDPIFGTDASGNLNSVWFYDTDLGNPDSLGNSVNLSSNALTSHRSDGSIQYWAFFQNGISNSSAHPDFWSISTVPEPGTLALLGVGLAGLGLSRRRRVDSHRKKRLGWGTSVHFITLVAAMAFCASVHAVPIRYTYTGGAFNYVAATIPDAVTNLNFSFVAATQLAPSTQFRLDSGDIGEYVFWDGLTTVTSETAGWNPILGWVRTDAFSGISGWSFYIDKNAPWAVDEARVFDSSYDGGYLGYREDFVVYSYNVFCGGYCSQGDKARNYSNGGTWQMSAVPVPEPDTTWLLLAALAGLGLMGRRTNGIYQGKGVP